MSQQIGDYLLRRKIKRAVVTATEALYSEDFDMDSVAAKIAQGAQKEMVLAYVAIEVAAQLCEPIRPGDVEAALTKLCLAELNPLEHQKQIARWPWEQAKERILAGKAAYAQNKYSLVAAVYQAEKAKKGPLSSDELDRFAKLTNELEGAELALADHLEQRAPEITAEKDTQQIQNEIEELNLVKESLDDPETLFSFGEMCLEGDGVQQSYVEAASWFLLAAELGHSEAQHNLALMYENGQGVSQDYFEAARWYDLAAEQGNAGSQNNLALLYEAGTGVPKDYDAAVNWFMRASESGDANGSSNLRRLTRKIKLERYTQIVSELSDLIASRVPLIGDCANLPCSKAEALYAIKFVIEDYEAKRETETNQEVRDGYDRIVPTLNYLFSHLARDWQDIAEEDRETIARLAEHTSFPDWARNLKNKYIDDERASKEALQAAFQVMKDQVDEERIGSDEAELL
jgi:TPR repeat protein